jgi:hypothetical protein
MFHPATLAPAIVVLARVSTFATAAMAPAAGCSSFQVIAAIARTRGARDGEGGQWL